MPLTQADKDKLAAAKVTCDAYYADAVDQILGLQKFYRAVQSAGEAH